MKLFSSISTAVLGLLLVASPASAAVTGTLLPVSDGNYTQWTPKTGSTHYTLVDETTCNGTTDYNSTNTVNNRDSYGIDLSTIPEGSTITQIDITPCASKNQSGGSNSTVNVFYRLDGADSADAGNYSVSGTTPAGLSTTSFGSLSTNKSSTTTLEIGVVLSAGTKGARLGRIATVITYTPLTAPSGLNAIATGSAIRLTWNDSSSNEGGFRIERSDNGGAFAEINTVGQNIKVFDDVVTPEGTYAYRVRAYNAGGNSNYTNTSTAYVISAPTSLNVVTASPSVSLTWTDNASSEDGFKIERRVAGVGSFIQVKTVGANVTATTDNNRPAGTYEYRVRAFKSTSNSDYSNTDQTTVLVNPTGLSAVISGTNDIQLNWNDNSSNEDGYYIERKEGAGSFTQIDSIAAGVNSYLDQGLSSGTYTYRVRGFKSDDTSAYTATASATVL